MSRSFGKSTAEQLSVFRPVAAPRSLAHELIERLTADITGGKLAPGARLPTEQEMIAATGVSRTVVREAVAALRAEGLVVTRQGVGAFVADQARRPFRIDPVKLRSLREVLEVMELRTGIEIEAAGLAAERATAADVRKIGDAYEAMTSDRVYRPAIGPVRAREELLHNSGTQFSPAVVEAFLHALDREGVPVS